MLDRYHWGTVSRISPEAPVPVVKLENTTIAAGGAANVAANAAGLGASVRLFGITGRDADGDVLRAELERLGVSGSDLLAVGDRATIVKTRIVAHSQQVVRLDQENSAELTGQAELTVAASIERALADSDLLVVSDYAKGLLTDRLLTRLITFANDAGKLVLVDPKGKDYRKYKGADLITPNQREALEACSLEEGDAVDAAGEMLVRELGIESVLITRGESGMTLYERTGAEHHFAAQARKVYDVTGAGDTVIAALGTALAAGVGLAEAVEFANLAAGLVVEQVGTTVISKEMLIRYVHEHAEYR
ncbi:MAG: D-glycero-beta-D-manno-heptose-7-phosphate kinase [Acidobacteria bacterium]|nr:D-glycero-beta-D-manno-heptose-7-phosphate kinase [Acidobacteriota bacterium]